jgi:hypothetical protein
VWVPDAAHEALRDLMRAREVAKSDQLRARNRLGKFLLRQGRRAAEGTKAWTGKYLKWIKEQVHFEQPAQEATLLDYLHEVEHAGERIQRLEKSIDTAIETVPQKMRAVIQGLQSLRGIAKVSAVSIVAELLVKLGHVALDGTKVKANASKHKAMSYDRMGETELRLKREVREWFDRAKSTDEAEDRQHGRERRRDELPEWVADKQRRIANIREAREAALEPKDQRNFTDPESQIMRKSGKELCAGLQRAGGGRLGGSSDRCARRKQLRQRCSTARADGEADQGEHRPAGAGVLR